MIPFYVGSATGGQAYSFDDQSQDRDLGNAFTASLLSTPITAGLAGGWSTLRRFVQALEPGTSCTMVITPYGDGSGTGIASQTYTYPPSTDVPNPAPDFRLATFGTRFQIGVAITAHVGKATLGEAEMWIIPRRTMR